MMSDLHTAVATLRHRGPDDNGVWSNGQGVALGHTRLSILDLSEHGHQPKESQDGRYTLTFNGEIYNFAEIRKSLTARGHKFSGCGDTEVILAGLQEWGHAVVDRFIGMFSLVYWDAHEQQLSLVRDRIGVKPLYFGWDGRTFCFASELKALLSFSHLKPEMDLGSVGEFLQYGYIAGDRSIFRNVYKLAPGHRLTLRRKGDPDISSYWSVLDALESPSTESEGALEERLDELMADAFRYRMVSDVPVGVFLSGGVDSSLVTAILARDSNRSLRTFTIGFSDEQHNEAVWAKKLASYLGTVHTEYILGEGEALGLARRWGELFDEPFGDSSGIPTLLVSKLASEEVKVVLSADGGDELFSGYRIYDFITERARSVDRIPAPMLAVAARLLRAVTASGTDNLLRRMQVPSVKRGKWAQSLDRLQRTAADPSLGALFDMYLSFWTPAEISRLLGDYRNPRTLADGYPGTTADRISLWDFHHYLPEDILTKVDRTTMAASIEGREPLLDHRLAEFAFRLPLNMRRGELGPKHILKKALYRLVPREFVDRPKKGFSIPLEKWLRNDMKTLVDDYLSEQRIRNAGILDPCLVRQSIDDFYSGDTRLTTKIWFLLAFEMWRERWGP